MPIAMLAASEQEDQRQVLERQAAEIGAEELAPEVVRAARALRARRCARAASWRPRPHVAPGSPPRRVAKSLLSSSAAAFMRRIAASSMLPSRCLQRVPGLRQALRQIRAVEQHRVVARKILPIVGEHGQAVLVDLGVGRVDVDRIDLALGDGFVGEAVIEAARRRERQLVRALQSGPAVGAADELLRQPEPQLRMRLQIGQAGDAFGARVVAAHRQRVGVVEAERHRDREPHRRELRR